MANPGIVPAEMKLYSVFCPEGRLFQKGEEWPGEAWSDRPGGSPVGSDAVHQAMNDLIEAQDRIDALTANLAAKDHDLAQMAKTRDEAVAALNAQKQALLDAQKAQKDAEALAAELTKERDRVLAQATKARAAA